MAPIWRTSYYIIIVFKFIIDLPLRGLAMLPPSVS
nr:MAG TPA_asm: hypothetical protein [Caudoviricetes sp.]